MLLSLIPLFIIECLPVIIATLVYEIRIIYFLFFSKQDRPISPRYSFDCVAFLPWKVPEEKKTWQGKIIAWSCGIVWFLSEFTLDIVLIALGKSIEDGSKTRSAVGVKENDSYIENQLQQQLKQQFQQQQFQQQQQEFTRFMVDTDDETVEDLIVGDTENTDDEEDEAIDMVATIEEQVVEEDIMEDVVIDMTVATDEEGMKEVLVVKEEAKEEEDEVEHLLVESLSDLMAVQLEGIQNSDQLEGAESHSNAKSESEQESNEITREKGSDEEKEECQSPLKQAVQDDVNPNVPQAEAFETAIQADDEEGSTSQLDDTHTCSEDITPKTFDRMPLTQPETPVDTEPSTTSDVVLTWSERKTFSTPKPKDSLVDDLANFANLFRQTLPQRFTAPVISPGVATKVSQELYQTHPEYIGYSSDHSLESCTEKVSDNNATDSTTTQKKKKKKNKNKKKKKNQEKLQEQDQSSDATETDVPVSVSSMEDSQTFEISMESPLSKRVSSTVSTIAACSLDDKFTELGSVAATTMENGDVENLYLNSFVQHNAKERKPSRDTVCAK